MDKKVIKKINLVPLIILDTHTQLKIREIRNEDNVRKWMFTDHIISVNEHLSWINQIKEQKNQIIFAVLGNENTPLGVASVSAIDRCHRKADWAYYLTENARGGLGSALEFSFINFIFDYLPIDKLNCEVIEGNESVVKLHKKFHFEEEGFRRSNIIKNNARVGVYLLGLRKQNWLKGKKSLKNDYAKIFAKFSITINWKPNDQPVTTIDKIEAARAKNNLNWMSILRLAIENNPTDAKPIIDEIRRIDREISTLTDDLLNLSDNDGN